MDYIGGSYLHQKQYRSHRALDGGTFGPLGGAVIPATIDYQNHHAGRFLVQTAPYRNYSNPANNHLRSCPEGPLMDPCIRGLVWNVIPGPQQCMKQLSKPFRAQKALIVDTVGVLERFTWTSKKPKRMPLWISTYSRLRKSWNMDLGRFMLVVLLSLLFWDQRTVIFQVSGFYCIGPSF